ncbi:MAG: FKBP-type peptidyl-prolyl cis-trans isomerase [Candidatus Paceibacterota bacterium]
MQSNQESSENMDEEEQASAEAPQMTVLQEGSGDAVSKNGDTLSVLYAGYLQNGEIFDSNIESGQAFEFTLGAGQVISGWEIGLANMKVGEIRRLVLPPAFAYGSNSVGSIPANSTLIFDVELKEIK